MMHGIDRRCVVVGIRLLSRRYGSCYCCCCYYCCCCCLDCDDDCDCGRMMTQDGMGFEYVVHLGKKHVVDDDDDTVLELHIQKVNLSLDHNN